MLAAHAGLPVVFLVDSIAQPGLVEAWFAAHPGSAPFDVLLEVGVEGGRCGCHTHADAAALARALHASAAVRLAGIECYEGRGAKGRSEIDVPYAAALMDRVDVIARLCDAEGLFDTDEVLMSAGGSAIFDLVAARLRPWLACMGRPVRGLLRPGCYLTRDLSFGIEMPIPFARAARGSTEPGAVPASWGVTGLNDQHAYLRRDAADDAAAPVVGERVGLGISHPCTTFDKWHWMPVVENDYRIVDAVTMQF